MKKLIVVLIAAFSIITACMIYLIKEGVSLRLGRVIEPTLISLSEAEVARGIVSRLTPLFQPSKFVVFGFDKQDQKVQTLIQNLQKEFAKDFEINPQLIDASADFIKDCKTSCWILSSPGESSHLQPSSLIDQLKASGEKYFTISVLRFDRNIEVPPHCENEKRITIDCVAPIAVREARRKFKKEEPYFFIRNYNEKDYFLLIEN